MLERKVRILHDGRELFLVDDVQGEPSRSITVLRRVQDGEPLHEDAGVVLTDIGPCVAVARWQDGALAAEPGHDELARALEPTLGRYLEEFRVGGPRGTGQAWWFLSAGRKPLFELSPAHPHGLSVLVFSDEQRAEDAARSRRGIESRTIEVEPIGDLSAFLLARASEGYAGATVDERDPVYFCADEAGDARFLRLSMDPRGRLQHGLLQQDGRFAPWEGEEDIDPQVDVEASDRIMVDRLGDQPYLGFHEAPRLFGVERRGAGGQPQKLVLEDDEPAPSYPVFQDEELGTEFLAAQDDKDLVLAPVDDLLALVRRAGAEGSLVRLNPGSHRARAARLWLHDSGVVLDSYSGVWRSADGRHFEKT